MGLIVISVVIEPHLGSSLIVRLSPFATAQFLVGFHPYLIAWAWMGLGPGNNKLNWVLQVDM
jgi:hypothetical protein